jgi:hypothetical protein
MNKPKSKAAPAEAARPTIGRGVIVRSPFFSKPTAGILIGIYEDDTADVVVQAFPVGRDPLQIPAIPYFLTEPDASVRSAVWPA